MEGGRRSASDRRTHQTRVITVRRSQIHPAEARSPALRDSPRQLADAIHSLLPRRLSDSGRTPDPEGMADRDCSSRIDLEHLHEEPETCLQFPSHALSLVRTLPVAWRL